MHLKIRRIGFLGVHRLAAFEVGHSIFVLLPYSHPECSLLKKLEKCPSTCKLCTISCGWFFFFHLNTPRLSPFTSMTQSIVFNVPCEPEIDLPWTATTAHIICYRAEEVCHWDHSPSSRRLPDQMTFPCSKTVTKIFGQLMLWHT